MYAFSGDKLILTKGAEGDSDCGYYCGCNDAYDCCYGDCEDSLKSSLTTLILISDVISLLLCFACSILTHFVMIILRSLRVYVCAFMCECMCVSSLSLSIEPFNA